MHNHAFLALCLQSYWYLVLQHTPVWCCLIIWSTSRLPLQIIHFMQENKTELFKHCFHNACSWGLNKIACHYTVKLTLMCRFAFLITVSFQIRVKPQILSSPLALKPFINKLKLESFNHHSCIFTVIQKLLGDLPWLRVASKIEKLPYQAESSIFFSLDEVKAFNF